MCLSPLASVFVAEERSVGLSIIEPCDPKSMFLLSPGLIKIEQASGIGWIAAMACLNVFALSSVPA